MGGRVGGSGGGGCVGRVGVAGEPEVVAVRGKPEDWKWRLQQLRYMQEDSSSRLDWVLMGKAIRIVERMVESGEKVVFGKGEVGV